MKPPSDAKLSLVDDALGDALRREAAAMQPHARGHIRDAVLLQVGSSKLSSVTPSHYTSNNTRYLPHPWYHPQQWGGALFAAGFSLTILLAVLAIEQDEDLRPSTRNQTMASTTFDWQPLVLASQSEAPLRNEIAYLQSDLIRAGNFLLAGLPAVPGQ